NAPGAAFHSGGVRSSHEKRAQETFGAAAPGRRVLYSASWTLARPRRGDDAQARYATRSRSVKARSRERVTSGTAAPRLLNRRRLRVPARRSEPDEDPRRRRSRMDPG